ACYEAALSVRKRGTAPLDWAETQNNLGNAYKNLPTGDRARNLQQAITCYNAALSVRTRETTPLEWATTQNNLGNAYREMSTGDRAANLKKAITCYNAALSVRTCETAPLQWAMTQNNLGNAYREMSTGDRTGNLQQAITCYEAALSVRTRETAPLDWAETQNNLGLAYSDLPMGDRAGNLQQAISCFKAALTVRTPQLFPLDCLQTARNWGNLEFREGQWHNALTQYQTAIEAIEQSRRFALSEERRQQIVQESIYVYENAIQAAINLKDIASALEIVERVRAKRLVDLMATADLYQDGAIPAAVQDWLHQLDQLDREIAQRRQNVASTETPEAPTSPEDSPKPLPETPEDDASPGDSPKHRHGVSRQLRAAMTATEEIRELEQEKQAILDQLSNRDDVVAKLREVQPPKLQDFQPLLSENTALVSFYTTDDHTHLLILRSGESQPVCFTCPGQGYKPLQLWLRETWAALYLLDKTQWLAQMQATLQELAQRLRLNDLIEEHLQGIEELVLVPHLFLHQIPFAALPLKDGYLGDRFRLRYAPSLQVLGFCQGRQGVQTREYGTVENATDDLPFSSFEGATVAHLFEIESQRRLIGAQAKTTAYRGLLEASNYLVSSHHAQSRWDNPLESGLKLSDGTITVSQLFSPAWRFPQLEEVYLSCCETGLFLPDSALDEPVAVSTGFLCAGARGVIASQWSIYDLSVALVSGLYHQQRHQGLSRVAALQRAQQEMRQMTGKTFQQAYAKPLRTYLKSEQRRLQQDVEAVHRLQNGERLIKRYCHEAHPFEHPVHWAGLGCYGLG
ncbi:MAG: CHAT domain-containing protein, partial [Phormidium sp. BM_Day4_Bin.17]|nr:CHAT domain-containing protein [Phormidium sp. BM_Day4_Bin.17]